MTHCDSGSTALMSLTSSQADVLPSDPLYLVSNVIEFFWK